MTNDIMRDFVKCDAERDRLKAEKAALADALNRAIDMLEFIGIKEAQYQAVRELREVARRHV